MKQNLKKINFNIDPELFWKLKAKAVAMKTTVTNLIIDAVKAICDKATP